MNSRKNIPNPSKLSKEEQEFIKSHTDNILIQTKKSIYKGRMISMSDAFFEELNQYLKHNPTEGTRSSFIVRIVADYIKSKKL